MRTLRVLVVEQICLITKKGLKDLRRSHPATSMRDMIIVNEFFGLVVQL